MRKPQRSEELLIDGSVGKLEALLEVPEPASAAAVVCHPHPLHGGTMHNKVAHTLARAFLSAGFVTLRFNFRGVGNSEGEFDDGEGEVADVLAAVRYLREQSAERPLWLAGFSLGAAMATRAAVDAHAAGLVTVAPATSRFGGTLLVQPDCPWLIVHGEDDELVPVDETIDWVNSLDPGPELIVLSKTTHFFHGKLVELRECVREFVERNLMPVGEIGSD